MSPGQKDCKMKSVVIFSDMFLPTFPYLEMPLYDELVRRGLNVTYVLQDGDIRLTDPTLRKKFESLNLKTVAGPKYVASSKISKEGDILLMRFAYKGAGGEAATAARKFKRIVFMYDPSGIDIRVRACPAHYLTAKSKKMLLATLKKFPKQYRRMFTTGTIHYDPAATTEVDRDSFMESYDIDPAKKLAVLTPANPGEMGHQKGINDEYTEIIDTVRSQCPDYEIVVKAHPLDYTASMIAQPGIVHKNEHYGGKHSWEKFAPGIKVIRADEGYKAIAACNVVINVRSSIAMETCLFRKPLVNVNRWKYTTNWPYDEDVMLDSTLSELPIVLNTDCYNIIDEAACQKYIKENCCSDDGKAYKRTADMVLKVAKGEL